MKYEVVRYNEKLIKYKLDVEFICFSDLLQVVKNSCNAADITELGNLQYWNGNSVQLYRGDKRNVYLVIPKGTFEAIDNLEPIGEIDTDWYFSSIYKFYAAIIALVKGEKLPEHDIEIEGLSSRGTVINRFSE